MTHVTLSPYRRVQLSVILALLQFLLPGFAWILISGLFDRFSFLQKLVLSFVLSISISSLLAAGLSLLNTGYTFLSTAISIILSTIVVGIFLAKRRPSTNPTFRLSFGRNSLPPLTAIAAYAVVLVLLFWSAPFYPTTDANDPVFHAQVTEAVNKGEGKNVLLHANFSVGLHFASSTMGSLLSVDALQSLRILLSLVVLAAIALTYFSANALLGGQRMANIAVLIAAFAMPVEAIHFIRVGTFPNVLADVVVLAILWLIFSYIQKPSLGLGLTLALLGLGGIFAHSSFLLFLLALWISIPVFFLISGSRFRIFAKAVIYSTIGPVVLILVLFGFFARSFERITGYVAATDPLIIFQQLALNFVAFAGPVNTLAIALAALLTIKERRRNIALIFALSWLLLLVGGAFFSSADWRFVLFSLLPAVFLIAGAIGFVFGFDADAINGRMRSAIATRTRILLPLTLIALFVSGGFLGILSRAYDPSMRERQEAVFESMQWLKYNGVGGAVASVGLLSDYRYLPVLTGISYVGDFPRPAAEILALSAEKGFAYVAVAAQSSYFQSFEQAADFRAEYRNSVVVIYFIIR